MKSSLAERLDRVERKPLKCGPKRTSETFVRGGELFDSARQRCGFSMGEAADHYGVSPSLLQRQMTNQDNQHLSFQRICEMPPAFRTELALGLLEDVGVGVEVETVVRIKKEKAA